jgi:type I restriction enzyme S subunit
MTWKISELNEIAEYIGRGKSPVYDNESALPVLNQACIQHGRLDLGKLKFVSEAHFGSLDDQKKTRQGDIFVNSTGTGTLGRIAYWDSDTAIAYDGHVTLVRLYPEHEPKFFYYLLQAPEIQTHILNNCISGSTNQVELSREPFRRIQLRHPEDRQEQVAIAAILTTVDRAIAQTEALIAKQRRIKAGLLHDLLTRGIDDAGRLRDPATHRFKETAVGLVPVEWEVERFGRHVESSAFGPRFSSALYAEDGSAAMLRTTDLDDEGNVVSVSLPRANLDLGEYAHHFLKEGDVVVSRSGTIGVTTVFSSYEVPVIPAAFMIRFRMLTTMNPTFIRFLFNSPNGRRLIYSKMAGGVQSNITSTSLASMEIPIPNPEEQGEICRILGETNELLAQTQLQLNKLNSLKSGLMQDLLTGRVAVREFQ